MPTRSPTISESARLVSSVIRAAAASVSFITCGRGRGFALAGVVDDGVISVIYSILAGHQSRLEIFVIPGCALLGADPESSTVHRSGFRVRSPSDKIDFVNFALCSRPGMTVANASPHVENEARLV